MEFRLGISKKFDRDYAEVMSILAKGNVGHEDRLRLLDIYQTSYHTDGKIEGVTSCDSSCGHCGFCQKMLEKAKEDPTLICGFCYDKRQEDYRLHLSNRHGLNMLIMSSVEFTEDELKRVRVSALTRVNSSGETPNVIYARNMLKIVKVNGHIRCGYWSKNSGPVIKACDELGKPSNLVLIKSSVHIGKADRLPKYFDYTFTVYPDDATTLKAIERGASECNGKKCRECGYKCYYGTHKGTDIAEVLRGVNEKRRMELVLLCGTT